MNSSPPMQPDASDSGLQALCVMAGYFRIAADPRQLRHQLALGTKPADLQGLLRAAKMLGLKARGIVASEKRLKTLPHPAIAMLASGGHAIFAGAAPDGTYRLVDPLTRQARHYPAAELLAETNGRFLLVARKLGGPGHNPALFGFQWFLPSLWRYRKPLAHVLIASLFVQMFALVTPVFFQVVVDKVLVHKGYSTLFVLVFGLAVIGLFDVLLQYLRTYALSHTTNRIDVELGSRLFHHLLRLPLSYFETRPTGQTVARIRELENIRQFLTGQGLFSAIDLLFIIIFIGVLYLYSWKLTLIVVLAIPVYVLISLMLTPLLRAKINEKFHRGALSQQFLVETVVGVQTLKAAAVEPAMQLQWDERLAAYVKTAFDATMLSAKGQNAFSYINKLTSAAILLFGAKAVMDGEMTVGALVAFNMIAGQVSQPILRLSQLWQEFQQVQISIDRIGDILNAAPERSAGPGMILPPPKGAVEFRHVTFGYEPNRPVLQDVSLAIRPGEVIGLVGPSGSGKSTLTKLLQRLYAPQQGQIFVDGADIAQVDPAWLRGNIGVVLQENLLFHCSIHDNIAFANPAMPRALVMHVARLAGADTFIDKLPAGYDTIIEERGANLSGGQRQRLAIARALATNPPMLIFDEATSALDYESESIIHANMRQIVKGRTVIIIAHRLAAVRHCDRIFGLDNGRIVEEGNHHSLIQHQDGLYARLWRLQTDQQM